MYGRGKNSLFIIEYRKLFVNKYEKSVKKITIRVINDKNKGQKPEISETIYIQGKLSYL